MGKKKKKKRHVRVLMAGYITFFFTLTLQGGRRNIGRT